MSTRIISSDGNEGEVDTLIFNLKPSDEFTITSLVQQAGEYILLKDGRDRDVFIDKHSIDNLILALQEAKRLWGDE